MTPWEAFIPRLAQRAPGVDRFSLIAKVKESARRYFTETRAWRIQNVVLAGTAPGVAEYALIPNADRIVVAITAARLDDDEIDVALPGEQNDEAPGRMSSTPKLRLVDPEHIQLLPAPDRVGMLVGEVAYCPSSTVEGLDDAVFVASQEAITYGTLKELLLDPSAPYTNPVLADYYRGLYQQQALFDSSMAGPTRSRGLRTKPC